MSQNLLTYEDQYVMQLLINDLTKPQRMGAYEIMGETNEDLVLDDNIELLIPKLCQKSIEELRPYILSAATSNLNISKLFFTLIGNSRKFLKVTNPQKVFSISFHLQNNE